MDVFFFCWRKKNTLHRNIYLQPYILTYPPLQKGVNWPVKFSSHTNFCTRVQSVRIMGAHHFYDFRGENKMSREGLWKNWCSCVCSIDCNLACSVFYGRKRPGLRDFFFLRFSFWFSVLFRFGFLRGQVLLCLYLYVYRCTHYYSFRKFFFRATRERHDLKYIGNMFYTQIVV